MMEKNREQKKMASRAGPRPLGLHYGAIVNTWMGAVSAAPLAFHGAMAWHPSLAGRAAALADELAGGDEAAFLGAVSRQAQRRLAAALEGLARYRRHPGRRALAPVPAVWARGGVRLLDFGDPARPEAPVVLVVPSLVNPSYVLDLTEERSLMRFLGRSGLRPLLVDWGHPGDEELGFDLTGYITSRLEPALAEAVGRAGGPVGLVGYCMGGDLALALATRHRRDIAGLAVLATPWDFHAEQAVQARAFARAISQMTPALEALGGLPVDLLQAFFFGLQPTLSERKFRRFGALDPDSADARLFVALEDWVNDGMVLAAGVARDCLVGWYGENRPARGTWQVAGRRVDPAALGLPCLAAVPAADRIVPPASALALARLLPQCKIIRPPSGHVGMVVGDRAGEGLWQPLLAWLRDLLAR
jgi:polyhydroxyalkanoate synthase